MFLYIEKYSQVYGNVHAQVKDRSRSHLQLREVLARNSCCWALHQVLQSNVPVSHLHNFSPIFSDSLPRHSASLHLEVVLEPPVEQS